MFRLKNTKGSMTIEAVLVVSTVMLVVAGIVFASMLMYQKIILTKAASAAAQQGAEIWSDVRKEINSGLWEYDAQNEKLSLAELYYQLFDFSKEYEEQIDVLNIDSQQQGKPDNEQTEKLAKIRDYICNSLQRGLLKPDATTMKISYTNYLIERNLKVTLQQEIKIPLVGIVRLFGGKDTMTLKGEGTATVAEPAEYIRNIDLGLEYAKRASDALELENMVTKLKDKIFRNR